ncbi:MAG: stage III sporulation protein AB [Clostridia bacterium]|nr:stage III sporulation protein AB [Clostridia bacterium]
MLIIKYISLFLIVLICIYIGNILSKRFMQREEELKELEKALNMFETKLKFTYEPLGQIFIDISKRTQGAISELFILASEGMKEFSAEDSWDNGVNKVNSCLTKDDVHIIKGLGKLLGKTDIEGQLREINLVMNFLKDQIQQAHEERIKNEKLYRTLGITSGLTIFIILC